jgi:hypothetical protein
MAKIYEFKTGKVLAELSTNSINMHRTKLYLVKDNKVTHINTGKKRKNTG